VNVKVDYIRPRYDNLREWCEGINNVYIGRRAIVFIDGVRYPPENSPWANTFKITGNTTREQVIAKYRKYILAKLRQGELDITDLYGKRLGCWCKLPDEEVPCHGDVLLDILDYYLKYEEYPAK
jgi:hypothetical protein